MIPSPPHVTNILSLKIFCAFDFIRLVWPINSNSHMPNLSCVRFVILVIVSLKVLYHYHTNLGHKLHYCEYLNKKGVIFLFLN